MKAFLTQLSLAVFLLVGAVSHTATAQDRSFQFKGRTSVNYNHCADAKVSICKYVTDSDCSFTVFETITKKDGIFSFELMPNAKFHMTVSKDGQPQRNIYFDTTIPEEKLGSTIAPFEFEVEFTVSKMDDGSERNVYVFFDAANNRFNYNFGEK